MPDFRGSSDLSWASPGRSSDHFYPDLHPKSDSSLDPGGYSCHFRATQHPPCEIKWIYQGELSLLPALYFVSAINSKPESCGGATINQLSFGLSIGIQPSSHVQIFTSPALICHPANQTINPPTPLLSRPVVSHALLEIAFSIFWTTVKRNRHS